MQNGLIRLATENDAEQILAIYAKYILNTAITFETDVPSLADFKDRVKSISNLYPFLVYLVHEKIVGYAYANAHHERKAFRFSVDVTVYLDENYFHLGLASQLYGKLFELLEKQGFYNAFALITVPNESSIALHKKFGFELVGHTIKSGYKIGAWHDVAYYQKVIQKHEENPKEPIDFSYNHMTKN